MPAFARPSSFALATLVATADKTAWSPLRYEGNARLRQAFLLRPRYARGYGGQDGGTSRYEE